MMMMKTFKDGQFELHIYNDGTVRFEDEKDLLQKEYMSKYIKPEELFNALIKYYYDYSQCISKRDFETIKKRFTSWDKPSFYSQKEECGNLIVTLIKSEYSTFLNAEAALHFSSSVDVNLKELSVEAFNEAFEELERKVFESAEMKRAKLNKVLNSAERLARDAEIDIGINDVDPFKRHLMLDVPANEIADTNEEDSSNKRPNFVKDCICNLWDFFKWVYS